MTSLEVQTMAEKLIHLKLIYGDAGAREKFEELTAHLIRSERPNVERVRIVRGDGGIDAHDGSFADPAGMDVYQMKFFPDSVGDSQKAQIRDSFKRACENPDFRTKSWTLCLPIEMSVDEKQWFADWRAKQATTGIIIQPVWDAFQLEGLLYQEKNRHLLELFFKRRDARPLKLTRAFSASIVFNETDNLPQMFFDWENDIGDRLASKSKAARPYENTNGQSCLTVSVPITDDEKFLHGIDSLQFKIVDEICDLQKDGWMQKWTSKKGIHPAKITTPNTPEPISRVPGSEILQVLAQNRFSQHTGVRWRYDIEGSGTRLPSGASIRLESRQSQEGVGPEQRRVIISIPGKAVISVSIEPRGAMGRGLLPQGAGVPAESIKHCRTFTFSVRIDAEIMRLGNYDDIVQDYKAWIEWLSNELESRNAD